MPKTALHFGAGNIGRGFITPILQENGYEVALVDVDSDLVNKLNTEEKYSINFLNLFIFQLDFLKINLRSTRSNDSI